VSPAALPGIAVAIIAAIAACGPTPPDASGCRARLLPGDLVITEVFADFQAGAGAAGTDAGKEWFEIYNATAAAIDLTGLAITASRGDGSRAHVHAMREAAIAPGQYFTLGSAEPGQTPAYVDYGYGAELGDLANTDGGKLALACGGDEIDSASYTAVRPGHARELTAAQPPDYTLNDDPDKMGGFYTQLEYGVLFPLPGLGYLPGQEAKYGINVPGGKLDTAIAQTLRWYIGILY